MAISPTDDKLIIEAKIELENIVLKSTTYCKIRLSAFKLRISTSIYW